ncbi:hypothetical protein G6F63_015301 [Rhizopus arrhizus]|nr:hypothetical protein G6F63_015301 [Rhizopus arrhizus]
MQASPLTVLLARDARVDAFEGERLLQTFYLQAGVNQLDTRSFPMGSYSVTLRIYEDGVLVRSRAGAGYQRPHPAARHRRGRSGGDGTTEGRCDRHRQGAGDRGRAGAGIGPDP